MNVRSLNLNLVPILEALLRERSVTRAARGLGMTQPAVSNALAQLRVIFDDPILVRSGPRMTPTQRALELETPLAEWLAELERLLGPGEFDPTKESRTFTLATTDYVGFVLLPLLLAELARRAPGIRLRIQAWPHHRVTPSLERGEVDLMIGFYEQLPESHREESLFEDRFVCIVRKDHPRVGRRLTLAQYVKLEHILVSADPHGPGVVDHALAARGLSRNVALRLSHFLLVPAVVAATDYVAAIDQRVADAFSKLFALRILPPPLPLPGGRVGQVWHERTDRAPAHAWLRGVVSATAERLRAHSSASTASSRIAPRTSSVVRPSSALARAGAPK